MIPKKNTFPLYKESTQYCWYRVDSMYRKPMFSSSNNLLCTHEFLPYAIQHLGIQEWNSDTFEEKKKGLTTMHGKKTLRWSRYVTKSMIHCRKLVNYCNDINDQRQLKTHQLGSHPSFSLIFFKSFMFVVSTLHIKAIFQTNQLPIITISILVFCTPLEENVEYELTCYQQ